MASTIERLLTKTKGRETFVIGGKNNGEPEPYFHAYKQAPVGRSNAFN